MKKIIAPSILNANLFDLGTQIDESIEQGITRFHLDIMDGHFVNNLSFGPDLIAQFGQRYPMIESEVHLMIDDDNQLLNLFIAAKPSIILIPAENNRDLYYNLEKIKKAGIKAGVVLNPATGLEVINPIKPLLDQVLIMTVNPGHGGQKLIPYTLDKVTALRNEFGDDFAIEVDGGVNNHSILAAKEAGANVFVVGSYIYCGDIKERINTVYGLIDEN